MTAAYSTTQIAVDGGELTVGVWEPPGATSTIVAVHGVTASHRAWQYLADELDDVRIIAPDLRGRGRSNTVAGSAGMASHARDLIAVLDHFEVESAVLVGHSMGAFVAIVTALLYPQRVSRLVLIDGGLPIPVPQGLTPDELVSHILGPTAERLGMRFADTEAYLDHWREHPAFVDAWTPYVEDYFAYDLVPDGDSFRPATSYECVLEDTVDLNLGQLPARAASELAVPAVFAWVPRGLRDETPGLYPDGEVFRNLPLEVRYLDNLNHYTVIMSEAGAAEVARLIR